MLLLYHSVIILLCSCNFCYLNISSLMSTPIRLGCFFFMRKCVIYLISFIHLFNSCATMLQILRTLGISYLKSERNFLRKRDMWLQLWKSLLTMRKMLTSLFQKDKKPKYQKLLFLDRFRKGWVKYYLLNTIQNSAGMMRMFCSF